MRIQLYMSNTGYCSRRETERLLAAGRITVNGKTATKDTFVDTDDCILLDGSPVPMKERNIYLLLHKPTGIVCTAQRQVKNNLIDYMNYPERIFAVGRLDKDSEGLLLLTNDGDIVNKIMRVENGHEKEYIVTVDRPYPDSFLKGMASGVEILDQMTEPCTVTRIDEMTFRIILKQGLNRQIRRMTKEFGYYVTRLRRVRIMNLSIDRLPYGQWRELTDEELNVLMKDLR
ncbi:pseudouridine synthase [Alkalihalophilus marmarensis]|uniref:Pseudouridine synthase n=1 Tax=Alkalihalophilus marmarensis DSM 21297 TaxID=1188261 RepID=U6SIS7_9BACI|nr:pseudouridine synthase [Alkalihalophilus marmarensis]ERN51473.1 RNA pseudouridine synthase [Alkalihalophilus marmarensis DSM 21297]MCM3490314.1 pseudouridine synthase [Alkalihalophilus marmarensis]